MSVDSSLNITLSTQNSLSVKQAVAELKKLVEEGKQLSVEIKQFRNKRSLDANSYAWVLITQIADILKSSKEEVYIDMLRQYGQAEKELVSIIAEGTETLTRALQGHCHEVGESTANGKLFKHFRILRGSSTYDSREMAVLIDGIVSEGKELGIETMTPGELDLIKNNWRNET